MLILFTGGRGSGKSTIAQALYTTLDAANFEYVHQSTWRAQAKSKFTKVGWILYFFTYFRPELCNVFLDVCIEIYDTTAQKVALGESICRVCSRITYRNLGEMKSGALCMTLTS